MTVEHSKKLFCLPVSCTCITGYLHRLPPLSTPGLFWHALPIGITPCQHGLNTRLHENYIAYACCRLSIFGIPTFHRLLQYTTHVLNVDLCGCSSTIEVVFRFMCAATILPDTLNKSARLLYTLMIACTCHVRHSTLHVMYRVNFDLQITVSMQSRVGPSSTHRSCSPGAGTVFTWIFMCMASTRQNNIIV